MPAFSLGEVDPQVWSLFTERANREGWRTKALVVRLMDAYGRGDVSIGTPAPKELPQWAWLRAYYRDVAQAESYRSLDADAQWNALTEHVLGTDAAMSYHDLDAVPSGDRARILQWLDRTSALTARQGLTLRAHLHFEHKSLVNGRIETTRAPWQYEVLGLPPNQQAAIASYDGGWRIQRAINGKPEEWTGQHKTPEDALDTLARTFEED